MRTVAKGKVNVLALQIAPTDIETLPVRVVARISGARRNRLLGRYARDAGDPSHSLAARRDEPARCVQRMIRAAAKHDIDLRAIIRTPER